MAAFTRQRASKSDSISRRAMENYWRMKAVCTFYYGQGLGVTERYVDAEYEEENEMDCFIEEADTKESVSKPRNHKDHRLQVMKRLAEKGAGRYCLRRLCRFDRAFACRHID